MNNGIRHLFRWSFLVLASILIFFVIWGFSVIFFANCIAIGCNLLGFDGGNAILCMPGDPGAVGMLSMFPAVVLAMFLTRLTLNIFRSQRKLQTLTVICLLASLWFVVKFFGMHAYESMRAQEDRLEPKIQTELTSKSDIISLAKPVTLNLIVRNIDSRELIFRSRRGCANLEETHDNQVKYIFNVGVTCDRAKYEDVALKPGESFADQIVYTLSSPIAAQAISLSIYETAWFEGRIGGSTGKVEFHIKDEASK